ncbi:MAG: ABC transporter ATP-binding protein [Anaerolineae bacterium]|nr:ABC transporter ATP-binding protein [Anaerolineae bacterium]
MTAVIQFRNVSKAYGSDARAVQSVSFSVERGTIFALLGASGCGKTTTLRLIAGLEHPDQGEIRLDGQIVAGKDQHTPPEARQIGMVFQDYALFPHLSVAANIGFAVPKLSNRERRERVETVLELVGLPDLHKRFPHQLSGGQQQRIALARALAPQPSVVLLDEPFSNLDAARRRSTREEVRSILKKAEMTAIFVTHDQEEALSIADEVGVMRGGEMLQIGSPQAIYLRPVQRDVAAFVGEANFVPGQAHGKQVECSLGSLPLAVEAEGTVDVLVRPEMIDLQPDPNGPGLIEQVQFLGYDQLVKVRLNPNLLLNVRTRTWLEWTPGMRVNTRIRGGVIAYPRNGSTQPA